MEGKGRREEEGKAPWGPEVRLRKMDALQQHEEDIKAEGGGGNMEETSVRVVVVVGGGVDGGME